MSFITGLVVGVCGYAIIDAIFCVCQRKGARECGYNCELCKDRCQGYTCFMRRQEALKEAEEGKKNEVSGLSSEIDD